MLLGAAEMIRNGITACLDHFPHTRWAEVALTAEEERMRQELTAGQALMSEAGLKVIDHLQVGEPVETIDTLVNQLGIELVIVGHPRHKPWAKRWWRGSVDAVLIDRIKCTILVAADTHQAV